MQLALHECTHAIFVIACERVQLYRKCETGRRRMELVFGGIRPHGLERLFGVYKLNRALVDFSVPVFKGYVRNPSVPYS